MSNLAVYKFIKKSGIDLTPKRMNSQNITNGTSVQNEFRVRSAADQNGNMLADEDAWNLFSKYLTEEDAE